jgi:hypothetical protein
VSLITGVSTSAMAANTGLLHDVSSSNSLYSHIETMVNNGVMTVTQNGAFNPSEQAKRNQVARYLYNALEKQTDLVQNNKVTSKPFYDVPVNDFYAKYISEVSRLKVMNGYSNGYFGTNNNVTRGEVLAVLFRAKSLMDTQFSVPDYKNKQASVSINHRFNDVDVSNTFYNHIYFALESGIISPNERYRTNDSVTK